MGFEKNSYLCWTSRHGTPCPANNWPIKLVPWRLENVIINYYLLIRILVIPIHRVYYNTLKLPQQQFVK